MTMRLPGRCALADPAAAPYEDISEHVYQKHRVQKNMALCGWVCTIILYLPASFGGKFIHRPIYYAGLSIEYYSCIWYLAHIRTGKVASNQNVQSDTGKHYISPIIPTETGVKLQSSVCKILWFSMTCFVIVGWYKDFCLFLKLKYINVYYDIGLC